MIAVGLLCAMIIFVTFHMTVELTWKTEILSTTSCEGQDQILKWNYSTEQNETVEQIQWFFKNKTPMCYYSWSSGFHVSPLYTGRLELNGTTAIILKNVSLADDGEYTLYPNLNNVQTKYTQTIFLTVYESPAHPCTPNITILTWNVMLCSTYSCGEQQLQWRNVENGTLLSRESYLIINSSWNAERVLCCLDGSRMNCHTGDLLEFCTSVAISSTKEASILKATENVDSITCEILIIVLAFIVIVLSVIIFKLCWRKIRLCAIPGQNEIIEQENKIESNPGQSTPMMSDDIDLTPTPSVYHSVHSDAGKLSVHAQEFLT